MSYEEYLSVVARLVPRHLQEILPFRSRRGNRDMAMRHHEILRRLDPKMAAELLRAIEANNLDHGDND